VTLQDGVPVVKVIDFGVAKATVQKLTQKTLFTAYGQIVGTPAYMSPEQAEMSVLDIDTRSDVYSLGVLLYELLTGSPPLEARRLREAGYAEMQRLICEEEALRPSSRLSSLGETATIVAGNRGLDVKRLTQLLAADLDWVVMKALEKDRNRRYDTPGNFAEDIDRYLRNEAISARPPSRVYRLKKFVRRNRAAALTAAVVAVALIAGTAGSTWQALRATHAEEVASISAASEKKAKQDAIAAATAERNAKVDALVAAEAERKAKNAAVSARHALQIQLALIDWRSADLRAAEELLEGADAAFRQTWEHRYVCDLCRRKAPLVKTAGSVPVSEAWYGAGKFVPTPGAQTPRFPTSCLALSSDGRRVATWNLTRTVDVWDSANGQTKLRLIGHPRTVGSVAFSPDGRRIASGGDDGIVKIWDAMSGQETLTLAGHTGAVRSLAFGGDSEHLASCCQGTKGQPAEVKVWDITSQKQQVSIEFQPDKLAPARGSLGLLDGSANVNVALSRDGRQLAASIAETTVRMWDVGTGKLATSFDAHAEEVTSIAFSDNGQRIACGTAHGIVEIWDTATHQQQLTFPGGGESEETVVSLAFSSDGQRIVSGSANGSVKVWDATTGEQKFRLKGHPLLAKAAFDSDLIVSASMSADLLSDIAMWENGMLTKDVSKIPLTWEARQWHAETSQEKLTFSVGAAAANQLALKGDGERVVAWTANGTVTVWSTQTGQPKSSFKITPTTERIRALTGRILALSRDGRRLASSDLDRKVRLWDIPNGKQTFVLPDPTSRFLYASFDPDGRRLLTSSDKSLKLWDVETGRELLALKSPAVIVGVAISPNGQCLASMGKDRIVSLWDAVTGQSQLTLAHSTARSPLRAYVSALAFSPIGNRLVSTSDDALLKLWNAATGQELRTFKGHASVVRSAAFSPDGQRLVSAADDETVKVWDVATGQEMLTFKLPRPAVSVAFSMDGQRVVSASVDGTVRVWDAPNGQTTDNLAFKTQALRTGELPEN